MATFLKNLKIVYVDYTKFFTFLKIEYVEYTELYIFFKRMCTMNDQNNVNSVKRLSV